jgi:hypothetical protein
MLTLVSKLMRLEAYTLIRIVEHVVHSLADELGTRCVARLQAAP